MEVTIWFSKIKVPIEPGIKVMINAEPDKAEKILKVIRNEILSVEGWIEG